MASTSTSTAPKKAEVPSTSTSDAEIDKLLSREATAFQRELEVERIFAAFKLKCVPSFRSVLHSFAYVGNDDSPYDILDISETSTQEEIKKRYRNLSLCESDPFPLYPVWRIVVSNRFFGAYSHPSG